MQTAARMGSDETDSSEHVDPRPIHRGEGPRAVLLLHGLTGTPHDVAPLADALAERGFAVRAPRLAGHDDLEQLERSSWRDWYATAEAAFDDLRADGQREVMVLGFSAGSLLALRLAALRPRDVAGLAVLSVPLTLPPWQARGVEALARLRTVPGLGRLVGMLRKDGPDVRSERAQQHSPDLRGFPYPALAELIGLQSEVADLLPLVRAPLLLLHGRHDHTAPVELADRVAQRVASPSVRKIILPRSFHIITHDLDRDRARDEVVSFALRVLGSPSAEPPAPETAPDDHS